MKDLLDRALQLGSGVNTDDVNYLISIIENKLPGISIKSLEEVVKYFKAEQKTILTKDLLEWMMENDQTLFETEDCKVQIKTYVSSKVLEPNLAFKWLESHQYGDLIKDTLDFPKGELTADVETKLEEMGLSYTKKSGIHPQTLKKVMSDRLKDGEDLPSEEVGIAVNFYDECVVKAK